MPKRYDPEQVTKPLVIAQSAASVGGATSVFGLVIGSVYGTLRTETPILFSIVSGAQCFGIGFTFWATRMGLLNHSGLLNQWKVTRGVPLHIRDDLNPTPSDKVRASTIAGAFTGFSLGFLYRGPRNVIPGTIMFTLYGWGGQHGYNFLDKRNSQALQEQADLKASGDWKPKDTLMQRFAKSKWSPMSILTDEQYESILQEGLLKVEADIALIDDKIEEIKKMAMEAEGQRMLKKHQKEPSAKK
ncbi:hypothetical protein BDU57DRAFT_510275 [Ampelomyces quisqualis]|uniref:Uncharacterized protein n=1 Tax=Ampelomyces quisqualis TaxID=50730 RepID=A0A6A5R1A7_AMPQU|nr:hypothetical protein BDU57DRAFT_510275 [Ampelomyces quisqualis]